MAKQAVISALEEVFGEYVLNISKENLRIAALRGKLKLEKVQLDGEMIGSVMLGAVGLEGFGILSCTAESVKISVPWSNLEKEPTKFEIKGVHLICVPLMPSTAHKLYGGGTQTDPRCTLRAKAKRLTLSRLERQFWNGQIPDEGPVMKRIERAVREVEREQKKKKDGKRWKSASTILSEDEAMLADGKDVEDAFERLVGGEDLPELPRDWKVKLREKILRNMIASLENVHIRCEVAEGGLEFVPKPVRPSSPNTHRPAEERAFAFGFTLEKFVMRTATEDWKVGSHDTRNPVDGSAMSSVKGHLGPNEYVVKNNKIGFFHNLSMYWDDEPPVLLAETDVLRGNFRKLSSDKLQMRIAEAMNAMFLRQEPGPAVRQSIGVPIPDYLDTEKPHEYICENFESEIRARTSDREKPGPVSCSADVMPLQWTLNIRHHQYVQYRLLRTAIKSQQRFDTMLRQRPKQSPKEDPRSWWQYAIACVTSRPNSRPWNDVKLIVQNRNRYIELVVKKNSRKTDSNGYHAGLNETESSELLALEELLPIEAMSAFHLLALRRAYLMKTNPDLVYHVKEKSRKSWGKGLGRFRFNSSRKRSGGMEKDDFPVSSRPQSRENSFTTIECDDESGLRNENDSGDSISLLEAMTLRLGIKVWFIDWRLHDATINVILASPTDDSPIAHFVIRASGNIRSFGKGKRDFCFDISQCDMLHHDETVLFVRPSDEDKLTEIETDDDLDETLGSMVRRIPFSRRRVRRVEGKPDLKYSAGFLDLPPDGVVCRVAHGKNGSDRNFSISSHPVNFIWKSSLLDDLLDFFVRHAEDVKSDLAEYVRNAATPLARKAQLALLSPGIFALHLNAVSPKIWLPVGAGTDEGGVLLLDAGVVRVSGNKGEGDSAMSWDVKGKSIHSSYTRGKIYDAYMGFLSPNFNNDSFVRSETTVINPFDISVDTSNRSCHVDENNAEKSLTRAIDVVVSPVCLNLVDAEILARSFGRWYVRSIRRANRKASRRISASKKNSLVPTEEAPNGENVTILREYSSIPMKMSFKMQKLELALEGHSKVYADDDRSLASQDSAQEISPPVRTYLVEICDVGIFRQKQNQLASTSLTVADASILRLKDGSQYFPLKTRSDILDAQYRVLVRSGPVHVPGVSSSDSPAGLPRLPPIIQASLLHDGYSHLDEVEVDIDSVVLRVTPTTLKDCAKAFRRIAELTQLATKEMERKVHEEGRKARQKGTSLTGREDAFESQTDSYGRPVSPTASLITDFSAPGRRSPRQHSDSSILLRLVVKESTILAGRPTLLVSHRSVRNGAVSSYAVIQLLSNALIMFQSIENPDGTGSKTLHASIDNASALVNTEFERVSLSEAAPMIGPTGAELRVTYATENLGCVVSQDISADCETVKACMTPNDLSTMINICRTMFNRMKLFSAKVGQRSNQRLKSLSSLIRYQKKGTGIATMVRAQVQSISFVLLQAYKSHIGSPEFLDFKLEHLKMTLEGCLSALSGDCHATLSVNLLNSDSGLWEYAVEPFPFSLVVEQMPDEIILELTSSDKMQINLTGILVRDLAEMKFDFFEDRRKTGNFQLDEISPTVLSTVGLRRATESPSIRITNLTGFDLHVVPDSTAFSPESGLVHNGRTIKVESVSADQDGLTFSLRVAPSATEMIGERDSVYDLPVESLSGDSQRLYLLKSSRPGLVQLQRVLEGRASPDTVFTEATLNGPLSLCAEPIVEFCMHNQRLRSTVGDIYGLPKGCDLLSSSLWSPEDEIYEDVSIGMEQGAGQELAIDLVHAPEIAAGVKPQEPTSPSRSDRGKSSKQQKSNWLRPYLKNDSPEWTDMTCTLRMARERVMLPDNNWIWINDWSVDLSGNLGESTDADGWEYQADFETFSRSRRDYVRGDTCRRRRWTRTRMVRPPRLDDHTRLLKFVWDKSIDQHGNVCITIRSHVRIKNMSSLTLAFFVSSPSWDGDYFVGSAEPRESVDVPIVLASAVYLKIGRKNGPVDPVSPNDCVCSENIMIVPTGFTSSNFVRSSMKLQDVSGTVLHFLVEIRSQKGIIDVIVEPVLRVINLLPCQMDCQLGEVLRPGDGRVADIRKAFGGGAKQLAKTEIMKIMSGKEASFTAVSPWRKPHISLRVPGYQWSAWYRVVNRKSSTETWRPSEDEESAYVNSKGDADFADEFKSLIRFDRSKTVGDPLTVILSVECGHCPTLRVYSQYWVLDKTGFGCRFADGFEDMLNRVPDGETSRRSHLLPEEAQDSFFRKDMKLPGHQWSIGAEGMSLYFSKREKLTLAIETSGKPTSSRKSKGTLSNWISPLDISNVMPKTVISLDEIGGSRSFDLAVSVTVCPGIFSRTKLITLLPRYQIVNLLNRELIVAQDGCLESATVIPSKSVVAFHWEKGNLPPKVRLGAPTADQRNRRDFDTCWTNGRIRLDRVGITSMRLPTDNNLASIPMVVQAEVRLATKEQPAAVEVVIWSATEKSNNPLYLLRNRSRHTVLCRQPLQEEQSETEKTVTSDSSVIAVEGCSTKSPHVFQCGAEIGPTIRAFLGLDRIEEFVWVLKSGDVACFGFDDPEKPHILEWSCVDTESTVFDERCVKAFLEVDAMGSTSTLSLSMGKQVLCQIGAEHSTKVIEFSDIDDCKTTTGPMESHVRDLRQRGIEYERRIREEGMVSGDLLDPPEDEDEAAFGLRVALPGISVSVVDNGDPALHGREILLADLDKLYASFSQSREGYHEFELRLMSFQVDNFVHKSIHPVLIFCPPMHEGEPLLHMSAVRRLQMHSDTFVFRYAALRLLEVDIFLDRLTAETIARFIEPFTNRKEGDYKEPCDWIAKLTRDMEELNLSKQHTAPEAIQSTIHSANSGRIYFEQLHLHPVRLGFTFTQEWMEWNTGSQSMMIFQFIRGMASIANAPLTFTSFVVSHVFEAPQALSRVIATHYSSQLTKQIFAILGSLAIFGAPADFITNVGTGVRDFFYEPINGAVHGPKQFIEGLEAGTQSLARGVFVGVVRGAANVTELVNANLVGLTADDDFIDERKAHQRLLTDAMSRGTNNRTLSDSLILAGASVARGVRSGALGIVEQPAIYASKHGPVGFLKGVGKAIVGALVKPVVGVGDAAVLVMNHVSDATSKSRAPPKIPKRLRRALPSQSTDKPNCVRLVPYDERAAKAQKIVTGGESLDDVYIGHIHIPSHLIIASQQCLWAIDRRSREPWCVNWEEISHFSRIDGGIRVLVFSKTGLKTYVFHVEVQEQATELHKLLLMHAPKMGNPSDLVGAEPQQVSRHQIPGVKSKQVNHIFGSCNDEKIRPESSIRDEIDLVEQCFGRVKNMGSDSPTFFKRLDEEAWGLITSWGHVFFGLSSKRCIVAGIINGTGSSIQIKSTKLVEGGSPCYTIPTKEYDPEQGLLYAGGCILFFGWGNVPNLLNAGSVFMHIETNGFICDLGGQKSRDSYAEAMPGCQVGFLEKSYDDNGWWAKYWLLVRSIN